MDHHLEHFAATCTWAQVDRLVEEALVRFDPQAAEEKATRAAEGRHFDTGVDQPTTAGTAHVHGELDLPDALDLEAAVRDLARQLGELGSKEPLDVRRAHAPASWPAASSPSTCPPATRPSAPPSGAPGGR